MNGRKGSVGYITFLATVGQVAGYFGEVIPSVQRAVHKIGAHIEDVRIVFRQVDGGLPVPAEGPFSQLMAWGDVFAATVFGIETEVVAKLEARVNGGVVAWVNRYLHTIAAHDRFVAVVATLLPAGRCLIGVFTHPDTIVLQATINAVGLGHIYGHVVELAQWRMVALDPALAIVIRDIDATVITQDEVPLAIRIDPKRVVVGVHIGCVDSFPLSTTIIAA